MIKTSVAIAMAVLLSACQDKPTEPVVPKVAPAVQAQIATPAQLDNKPVLSAEAYGPVQFGAALQDVETKLGEKSQPLGAADPACSTVQFKSLPAVRFMVEQGVITRADTQAGVPNIFGIDVGATLAQAKQKIPDLIVGPHKYLELGHYLTFAGNNNTAVVMEEDGNKITKIRGGLQPSVAYVEVCG